MSESPLSAASNAAPTSATIRATTTFAAQFDGRLQNAIFITEETNIRDTNGSPRIDLFLAALFGQIVDHAVHAHDLA